METKQAKHVCEPPRGCWESNLGALHDQPVLLTTELYIQSLKFAQMGVYMFAGWCTTSVPVPAVCGGQKRFLGTELQTVS